MTPIWPNGNRNTKWAENKILLKDFGFPRRHQECKAIITSLNMLCELSGFVGNFIFGMKRER
jgi:hypothetical protein